MRKMLITLMFSVVAKKSRTFSSIPCSANQQVYKSWEGAQPGSQSKLASGNIPYHRCHAQFINGGWLRGRNPFLSLFCGFKSTFVQEFKLCWEFDIFQDFCKIHKISKFRVL